MYVGHSQDFQGRKALVYTDPTNWSSNEVANWISEITPVYRKYRCIFLEHQIDGKNILEKDLEGCGILSKIHRRVITVVWKRLSSMEKNSEELMPQSAYGKKLFKARAQELSHFCSGNDFGPIIMEAILDFLSPRKNTDIEDEFRDLSQHGNCEMEGIKVEIKIDGVLRLYVYFDQNELSFLTDHLQGMIMNDLFWGTMEKKNDEAIFLRQPCVILENLLLPLYSWAPSTLAEWKDFQPVESSKKSASLCIGDRFSRELDADSQRCLYEFVKTMLIPGVALKSFVMHRGMKLNADDMFAYIEQWLSTEIIELDMYQVFEGIQEDANGLRDKIHASLIKRYSDQENDKIHLCKLDYEQKYSEQVERTLIIGCRKIYSAFVDGNFVDGLSQNTWKFGSVKIFTGER